MSERCRESRIASPYSKLRTPCPRPVVVVADISKVGEPSRHAAWCAAHCPPDLLDFVHEVVLLTPPPDFDDDITEDALAIEQHDEYRRITE